jgi:hypothetical protein
VDLTATVVAKVEGADMVGNVTHTLHLRLSINNENLEAQGGGILAAVKVTEELFNSVNPNDVITWSQVQIKEGALNG